MGGSGVYFWEVDHFPLNNVGGPRPNHCSLHACLDHRRNRWSKYVSESIVTIPPRNSGRPHQTHTNWFQQELPEVLHTPSSGAVSQYGQPTIEPDNRTLQAIKYCDDGIFWRVTKKIEKGNAITSTIPSRDMGRKKVNSEIRVATGSRDKPWSCTRAPGQAHV